MRANTSKYEPIRTNTSQYKSIHARPDIQDVQDVQDIQDIQDIQRNLTLRETRMYNLYS